MAVSDQLTVPVAPGATRATWARQAPSPWTAARRRFIRSRTGLLGTFVLLVVTLMAVFAAQVAPYNPTRQDFRVEREPPSLEHLMGTDEFGRDVLSRVIWGARQRSSTDASRSWSVGSSSIARS